MDGARFPDPETAYYEDANGAQWAGARSSVRVPAQAYRPTGTVIGLAAMVLIGFLCVAQGAVSLAPRVAPVQVATPAADEAAAPTAAAAPQERPLEVGPDPEVTDNGLAVEPWRWPEPLTVSERITLRSEPGEALSPGRGAVQPGRALRVIGRVRLDNGDVWLQVRTDDGGVAYLDSEDVLEVAEFRAREREAAAQARAEAEAEALAASGLAPGTSLDPAFNLNVPPSEAPPPPPVPEPGELY